MGYTSDTGGGSPSVVGEGSKGHDMISDNASREDSRVIEETGVSEDTLEEGNQSLNSKKDGGPQEEDSEGKIKTDRQASK